MDKESKRNNYNIFKKNESKKNLDKIDTPKSKRKLGYLLAGMTVGVCSFMFLKAGTPQTSTVRAELIEFSVDENFSNYKLEEMSVTKEPFLEYGGYFVSEEKILGLEQSGALKFGKSNPMFFLNKSNNAKPLAKPLAEESSSEQSELSSDNVGGVKSIIEEIKPIIQDADLVKEANGFNTQSSEIENADVLHISRAFANNAVLPLDSNFFIKTSTFGFREDPFVNKTAYHSGLDLSSSGILGAEIYSVLDGVVKTTVELGEGTGNYIEIDHNGFQTSYSHMILPSFLKEGQVVRAGDVIGYVGSTGRSTGPHLHFEVGIDNLRFDPEIFTQYIKGANQQ